MPPLDPVKSTLKHLNLRSNFLRKIDQDFFHGFIKLASLDLSSNDLNDLPDLSPVAQTLSNFKVPNNEIISISPSVSSTIFSILFRLDVARNKIKQFNLKMLNSWPDLVFLHIDFNLIETLEDMSTMTHGHRGVLKVCFTLIVIYYLILCLSPSPSPSWLLTAFCILSIHSLICRLYFLLYGPCMIVPHKWTKICWLATAN